MSNITLTTGIRQNLQSLQQTSADLTTTQEALATGDAVNSAAQNPSAYFTSQNLTNAANSLSALLDQIGQGSQTINAATNGLTGLTSLLNQALSTAQQAQQSSTGTVNYSSPPAGTQAIAADTSQISGTVATPSSGITASTQSTAVLSAAGFGDLTTSGDTLTFALSGGSTFSATFVTGTATGDEFTSAAGLASLLNANVTGATATTSGNAVTLTSLDLSNNITVGGTALTGGDIADPANFTASAATLGSALTVSDGTHTSSFYYVASNANAADGTFSTLAGLQTSLNSNSLAGNYVTAGVSGNALTLTNNNGQIQLGGQIATGWGLTTSADDNYNSTLAGLSGSLTVQVGSNAAHTITFGTGAGDVSTKAELTTALSGFTDITAGYNTSNQLTFTPTSTAAVTIGGTASTLSSLGLSAGTTTPTATVVSANSTRSTLQANYNSLLTQIDQLAGDSSYNGVNLLTGDNLVVDFNPAGTSSLTIAGVNDTSTGLGLSNLSNNQFQDNNAISNVVTAINSAISSVQAQTETFGTNSSTISTRQTFETNMINTLQTGASNLVAADQNEESADLLTEQTQQQLEISALSIANQANQSVLKLFG
jgi:flagellin